MNSKITDYLVRANELELPTADADKLGGLFHVVNDIERIGDHAENMAEAARERIDSGVKLSDKAIRQMNDMMKSVQTLLELSLIHILTRSQCRNHSRRSRNRKKRLSLS